ncbi:MAG: hypothetical protein KA807_17065 [Prolixibacteraceae bacterium]|nr:hypothetical protein [Prolixibacteraceae bacterium]
MNENFKNNSLNRKEFINAFGRYIILAFLAFIAVFILTRRRTTDEEECINDYTCGNCSRRDICNIDKSKHNH